MKTPEEWTSEYAFGTNESIGIRHLIRLIQADALRHAAEICRAYAHSGQNVYRRQVSYACENRIKEEATKLEEQ